MVDEGETEADVDEITPSVIEPRSFSDKELIDLLEQNPTLINDLIDVVSDAYYHWFFDQA